MSAFRGKADIVIGSWRRRAWGIEKLLAQSAQVSSQTSLERKSSNEQTPAFESSSTSGEESSSGACMIGELHQSKHGYATIIEAADATKRTSIARTLTIFLSAPA